jgi:glycosyltransferase involved in cell wall biosynthesis
MHLDTLRAAPFSTRVARPQLERAALRSRSLALRDVIASRASHGELDYPSLLEAVRQGTFVGDRRAASWLGSLARVVALQSRQPTDGADAIDLFRHLARGELDAGSALTYAQLLLQSGLYEELHERAAELQAVSADAEFPGLDLLNPSIGSPYADVDLWATRMSAALERRGLTGVSVRPSADLPAFDAVDAAPLQSVDGPLVSVVMTTYEPSSRLITSLASILRQTWQNLEVLLVDDASGPDAADTLAAACALDERVRLVRLTDNGGTYRARNAALAVANGHYVTGHDDDDWAHPTRIERQIAALEESSGAPATLSRAIWASEDLQVATLGWPATGRYAPSFLTRLDTIRRAGPYLEARKGADTELIRRIEAMTGTASVELAEPLNLYRTRLGSLSREDFAPGWDHPARVSFWQRSRVVHEEVRSGKIQAADARTRIAVPRRFTDPADAASYDVLLVADWRGPTQGQVGHHLAEALALRARGLRVAVVHLEDLRRAGERVGPMNADLLRNLNDHDLDEVYLDEDVRARTVLVRDAGSLAYADDRPSGVRALELAVVVEGAPLESTPTRGTFVLSDVIARAERMFGVPARLIGHDLAARQSARSVLPAQDSRVVDEPYLGVVDRELLTADRPAAIPGPPVVGLVVEHPFDSPSADDAALLLPEGVDARVLVVGASAADGLPENVRRHGADEISLGDFLTRIDVLLDFSPRARPRSTVYAAMAAGCVVVARAEHRAALGDAALYIDPAHASALYETLRRDAALYSGQVARARAFVTTQLGHETWANRLAGLGLIPDPAAG